MKRSASASKKKHEPTSKKFVSETCASELTREDELVDDDLSLSSESDNEETEHLDSTNCGLSATDVVGGFKSQMLDQHRLEDLERKYENIVSFSWSQLHTLRCMGRTDGNNSQYEKHFSTIKVLDEVDCCKRAIKEYSLPQVLATNLEERKNDAKSEKSSSFLTPLQLELFSAMSSYSDIHFPHIDVIENMKRIQTVYCLHLLRHVIKSRSVVLKNNSRLAKISPKMRELATRRDQGFVRPKVLVLLPFRETALQVISIILSLLKKGTKFEVSHKKRFKDEFKEQPSEDREEDEELARKLKTKPEDYQVLFQGNTDEHFQIGIALHGSSVRLYSPFYSSDIIVASPLALRKTIGEKGEAHYEHDFLSSVEILILDLSDVYLMQNWDHILHIKKHMHLTPKDPHDVDFSRVYNWALDGHSKHYCQTIMLSRVVSPQIYSLLTKHCFNHRGLIMIKQINESGSICRIPNQLPQIFHKLSDLKKLSDVSEKRFQFFISHILKAVKTNKSTHMMICIPQYYDFVRVRNHMRREMKSGSGPKFVFICEYSDTKTVGKARRSFFTGRAPILLYTERYHFYHRPFIRGIRHIVFYDLPTYPHFYSELCNMIHHVKTDSAISSVSISAIYSSYDSDKLAAVVGDPRCRELLTSKKDVHMFVTGKTS
uniref:U3 small nucleolar RNA-associated protein 25 homolog n=1 Tax=Phallusia mammillata TaxID=59560 RepID=A0A6F9D8R3_9ASCI|nr:digestive organ expansion factor homolog [Phallusia mammillata]